jgi:hypothetical protein
VQSVLESRPRNGTHQAHILLRIFVQGYRSLQANSSRNRSHEHLTNEPLTNEPLTNEPLTNVRIDLPQGTLDLLTLRTLALAPQHGWAVRERLQQVLSDVFEIQQKLSVARPRA